MNIINIGKINPHTPHAHTLTSNIFNKTLVYARLTPNDFPMEAKNMILNSDTITGVFTNVPKIAINCCTITILSNFVVDIVVLLNIGFATHDFVDQLILFVFLFLFFFLLWRIFRWFHV